jgi:hypothetical protein
LNPLRRLQKCQRRIKLFRLTWKGTQAFEISTMPQL